MPTPQGKPKILIVDDDPFILDMCVLKLKESNFEIESATNGKDAVKKLKEFSPDLMLLDVVMPAMDGFEVLKEIKKDPSLPKTKIVLLTNLGQREDVARGMQLGAHDYLIKAHFTPSEIVHKIKSMLSI